ncbi:Glycine cleavage system transcriptional antiactivator GcvR [hydrothermal vent metagenome]|uniref:Glycine cleavage system transcriptional antiactivator GcvR n=1 Tax=hydrothermal vent metagenome TaxID=652676 RepID=A0A3B0XJZ2_9ZZZZ
MKWSVLTLVGADQPGIVAALSDALYKQDCTLAQASMMQLGANFAIMLRVAHPQQTDLRQVLAQIGDAMQLHIHIDEDVSSHLPAVDADVQISVYGADRAGIVAQVTSVLSEAGLNIIDLETDIGGSEAEPLYIMTLQGQAKKGVEPLRKALECLDGDIEVNLDEITTLRG